MHGIRVLQTKGIRFNVIMVLTLYALDYPDEIFHFLVDNRIENVGFNIDEQEGINKTSSYEAGNAVEKYKAFMQRFIRLADESHGVLTVRELSQIVPMILYADDRIRRPVSSANAPLQLLTFDHHGNYSTFCPELAGTRSIKYNNFVMGNILTQPIEQIFDNPVFRLVNEEVQAGVKECEATCQYWNLCGGGFPSNKYFEHGRFDVTETLMCRIHKQATVDVVLEYLRNKLHSPPIPEQKENYG